MFLYLSYVPQTDRNDTTLATHAYIWVSSFWQPILATDLGTGDFPTSETVLKCFSQQMRITIVIYIF